VCLMHSAGAFRAPLGRCEQLGQWSRNHHKLMWIKMPDVREYNPLYAATERRRLGYEDKLYLKRIGGFLL
jgi:hypothetical protein